MTGKSANSNLNVILYINFKDKFLEQLGYGIDIKKSSINKYNFAIDNSTTYYVSKKIYVKYFK